ncbi:universal stress protein [Halalkalibacter urbisdiaboli]|uniref:universal stress protein n=1 Tax=Halalkalibacter urbisdiaboli TaxID=1960589 RepID=UPI000B43AF88|nr:universal stress protein [Halalkalibacter urbisdiaboli]
MFKRILLAADGSEHSVRATEKMKALLLVSKGTVDVVYVVNGATSKSDVLHSQNKSEIERKRKVKLRKVEESLLEVGIEYKIHILHGEPGPTIVDFANRNQYDCVVLGSRGLNRFQSMVLGSVSHKVAKRVNSPVLIVK